MVGAGLPTTNDPAVDVPPPGSGVEHGDAGCGRRGDVCRSDGGGELSAADVSGRPVRAVPAHPGGADETDAIHGERKRRPARRSRGRVEAGDGRRRIAHHERPGGRRAAAGCGVEHGDAGCGCRGDVCRSDGGGELSAADVSGRPVRAVPAHPGGADETDAIHGERKRRPARRSRGRTQSANCRHRVVGSGGPTQVLEDTHHHWPWSVDRRSGRDGINHQPVRGSRKGAIVEMCVAGTLAQVVGE